MMSPSIPARIAMLLAFIVCNWKGSVIAAETLPPNLVTNSSLEEDVAAEALPAGWGGFYSNPTGAYRHSIVDGGRTGKKQLRIAFAGEGNEGRFGVVPANRVSLEWTKRYVARGWVKVTGGKEATADVKLHYYGAGGAYLGQTRIGFASPGSDDWQLVTVTDHAAEFPTAKQIGLAVACTGDAKAQYDDLELLAFDKATLPEAFDETYGVTRSPETAILGRRVGTWTNTLRFKPSRWIPTERESTVTETIRWTLGGQFIEGRQKDETNGIEHMNLMTYDPRDRVYRNWHFGSNAAFPRANNIGRYDGATKTLIFETEPNAEGSSLVRMEFVGDDELRWTGTWKDKEGNVMLDIEATSKRLNGPPPARGQGRAEVRAEARVTAVTPPMSVESTSALNGTWSAVAITLGGEVAPAAALEKAWFKIKDTEISFKLDGPELHGRFTVDTQKLPHHINVNLAKDQTVAAEMIYGIYEAAGDGLTLCFQKQTVSGAKHPTDFTSSAKSDRALIVLKKQKP